MSEPTSIRLRDDYQKGDRPEHEWFNQVARWLNGMAGFGGNEVSHLHDGIAIAHVFVLEVDEDAMSFATLGDADEGAEAADTGDWEVVTTDGEGLHLDITTRVGYFDAGDETLYGYIRRLKFDDQGRLYYVGAETRITIDTPGTCS